MKAGVIAVAAALAGGAAAQPGKHVRRHAHEAFHERGLYLTAVTGTGSAPEPTCGCTTVYTTITGEGTIIFPSPTYAANTTSIAAPPTSTYVPVPTTYPSPVVPTPLATTCPTPGVYTIPATTVTLTESTTVCGATSTEVPVGTHTAGGVTTVVEKETTVVCPYAAIETNSDVTTSVIKTTTYVCPSAGTYTIAPLTTTVTESTVWVYPTPASYAPGTYTQPEVVTTVTKTNYVVFCPFTSPAPAPPSQPPLSLLPRAPQPSPLENLDLQDQNGLSPTPHTRTTDSARMPHPSPVTLLRSPRLDSPPSASTALIALDSRTLELLARLTDSRSSSVSLSAAPESLELPSK
ncbi:hypothetical protein BKA64DRAFT_298674 [Cadophora sp. MPI-SDFR-AT-0126]|nr:hypothetical protein BKA64DRAFT_298674 [Leotiomycetes sp. MPI-SDFR-AT-0126]